MSDSLCMCPCVRVRVCVCACESIHCAVCKHIFCTDCLVQILESQLATKFAVCVSSLLNLPYSIIMRGGGLGSSTIFKKFNEPYALS